MPIIVTFDCGHEVRLPHEPISTDPAVQKYWADQTPPALAGGVAACPGCITTRRPRGDVRSVLTVRPA